MPAHVARMALVTLPLLFRTSSEETLWMESISRMCPGYSPGLVFNATLMSRVEANPSGSALPL